MFHVPNLPWRGKTALTWPLLAVLIKEPSQVVDLWQGNGRSICQCKFPRWGLPSVQIQCITRTKVKCSNLIEEVILPYMKKLSKSKGLPPTHKGLIVLDVFPWQITPPVNEFLNENHPQHCTAPVQPTADHTHPVGRAVDYMVQCIHGRVTQNHSSVAAVYQSPCVESAQRWIYTSWYDWCLHVKDVSTNKHKCPHTCVFISWTISVIHWDNSLSISHSFLAFRYFWIPTGVTCPKESKYSLIPSSLK